MRKKEEHRKQMCGDKKMYVGRKALSLVWLNSAEQYLWGMRIICNTFIYSINTRVSLGLSESIGLELGSMMWIVKKFYSCV